MNSFVEDLGRFQTANEKMLSVVAEARRVAVTVNPVLILGNEGSGRRELALEIFERSARSKGRLIRWTNESFGACELYSTDTVLIENIETLEAEKQQVLMNLVLKSLSQSQMRGPRWITTAGRELLQKVRDESFLIKLYQILAVQVLNMPSLNERVEDVVNLAQGFVADWNTITGNAKSLSPEAVQKIQKFSFGRNVQQLSELIQKAFLSTKSQIITAEQFAEHDLGSLEILESVNVKAGVTLSEMERRLIIQTLEMTKQNRTRAAEILGISIRTLRNKLHEYREEGTV